MKQIKARSLDEAKTIISMFDTDELNWKKDGEITDARLYGVIDGKHGAENYYIEKIEEKGSLYKAISWVNDDLRSYWKVDPAVVAKWKALETDWQQQLDRFSRENKW